MAKAKSVSSGDYPALGKPIDRLGPINNKCRQSDGVEKVESLWDLGDALLASVAGADDALLREINDRSYITRDLLRYGLIIRRGWSQRADLRRQFPKLRHYVLFREALPFLKGDRCGIDDNTHREILRRLNEDSPSETKAFLKDLKGC
jgi:hypothetical protein